MKRYFLSALGLISILLVISCDTKNKDTKSTKNTSKEDLKDLARYVDPRIGTAKMGHTYPGATVPFGSIQLSPDTDTLPYAVDGNYNPDVYKYSAGYQYADSTIVGFSHTHFSGTGHSDLGDFLIMPTNGKLRLNPGTAENPDSGYRSRFSHKKEEAEPGYYRAFLDDYGINAEMTSSTRVGMHRYTFSKDEEAHIILDLMAGLYNYDDKNVWTFVRVENDTLITGFRQTNGWARTRKVFFAMSFDKPIKDYGRARYDNQPYKGFWRKFDEDKNFPEVAGEKIRMYFNFDMKEKEALQIKLAISPVSSEGALKNMKKEVPEWDFDQVKTEAREQWNQEFNKIELSGESDEEMTNFYTAMYHSFLGPTEYMDVDGKYRGLDMNIHKADGFTNYTTFSLWDTHRALHPLFNLIQPQRNNDMIKSMLAHYDQSVHGMLPVWSHYANENWTMIGYHAVSVISDAIVKGNGDFDKKHALDAMVQTANTAYYDGLKYYIDKGYVPEDKNSSSVSKTLEYAYDDWTIAQAAEKMGNDSITEVFRKRAENYKNVYDPKSGFMRPKLDDGSFKKDFDPLDTHGQGFIEGNSWNYSLYVPHDPAGMIKLRGGKERFAQHLDSLFTMELPDKYFENTEDITKEGIIGNYVHGNEPSHQVAYLYNWANTPWKAQEKVRFILKDQYQTGADGLGGNDDLGQMSAWYIFSSLGFYPVAPGSTQYALGSPAIHNAEVHLDNGKTFKVEAKNQSDKNIYVEKVELNGKRLDTPYIDHKDILNGAELKFYMTSQPDKEAYKKEE